MSGLALRADPTTGFTQVVGVGGVGTGSIFALQGNQTLGRNESRMAQLLDARDYCKLHIVQHYIAALMGSKYSPDLFRVFAVGNVGDDAAGATLLQEMNDAGIDVRYVNINSKCRTLFSVSFLYPDKSGGNITASNSAASTLSSSQLSQCRPDLLSAADRGIALCLPEVPMEARQEFLRISTECGSYRVASFTSAEMPIVRNLNVLSQVDLLALNRDETAAIASSLHAGAVEDELLDACAAVAMAANPKIRIISSEGAGGVHLFDQGAWSHYKAISSEVVSTAGAGDALLAGIIAGLSAGLPLANPKDDNLHKTSEIDSAIGLGLALAAMSITSPHTIHPGIDLESLLTFVRAKEIGLSPALQNKCFDGAALQNRSV
jgi:sugar/nucleoside kinase (ribokinase family)